MDKLIPTQTTGEYLPVMEIFQTLQGEGFHTGKAAVFIRLAGCDLACNWCDVKESWNHDLWPQKPLHEILSEVLIYDIQHVVITGGEPLKNHLDPLCGALKKEGYVTYLETSGACPLSGQWDWICLSPKKQEPPLEPFFAIANELKVVVETKDDLSWAETNGQKVSRNCLLYLQPEWSVRNRITPAIVEYILMNPSWMLSLQSHKYIGMP